MNLKMNNLCDKLILTSLFFSIMAPGCLSVSVKKKEDQLVLPKVSCSGRRIRAEFGPKVKDDLHAQDQSGAFIPVLQSEESCGVKLTREKNQILTFSSRYDSCYTHIQGSRVVVPLQVQLSGRHSRFRVNISCPLITRHSPRSRPKPTALPGSCDGDKHLRVTCGHQDISAEACNKLGCCFDVEESTCSYRLNTCSLDGHFVFSVKASDSDPPINPSMLSVRDQPSCSPVISTEDTAVFKIGVTECGAKTKVDGDVMVYEVELEELQKKSDTRASPFSLQVQCEYESSDLKRAADLRSLYAITNPPPVVAMGTIGVRMRIAKDSSFSSFFPDDDLPVRLPLREAAFVEISITQPTPDPSLSLTVRDCFARPSSRHSVWTLLYDGCPNPSDNMRSSVPVDDQGQTTTHSQTRRFDVKTFAFLDPRTGQPSAEEMFFYCWVEICTTDMDCAQRCAIISSEGNRRRRRETTSKSSQVQLVSAGPLMIGLNDTKAEESPCERQSAMFEVTVYILSGVGAALLIILIVTVCSSIRQPRKLEEKPDCSTSP